MKIEFYSVKDASNQAKYGMSLALSAELAWDDVLVWVDTRYEYGESRMIALAPEINVLYSVAFVDREEVQRIISLRRANRRELKHCVENL